jgi:uncharacterized protein (DUF58 family)
MKKSIYLLSLISFCLIFAGLLTLNPILISMAIPFVIYLFCGQITFPVKVDLVFTRSLSIERTFPGLPVDITVWVHNSGSSLKDLLVDDLLPDRLSVEHGSQRHIINLKHGETVQWKYTVKGKRGSYNFDSIQVSFRPLLGIKNEKTHFPTKGKLMIFPEITNIKRVAIHPHRTRVYSGEVPARSGGTGVNFFGVRKYQSGDPLNAINWQASARHPYDLFTNEYEKERVADVGIILDGRERINISNQDDSIFEYSVVAAATLSNAFLNQGDRVGLLHYGKFLDWTFPGYGKIQRERIFRVLTAVEPGHSLVFSYLEYLPTRLFPAGSQLVLISPLTQEDSQVLLQIRAIGYRILVISPDPISFEKRYLPTSSSSHLALRILTVERELLLRKLVRGGIQVVNWNVNEPFDKVVATLGRSHILHSSVVVV